MKRLPSDWEIADMNTLAKASILGNSIKFVKRNCGFCLQGLLSQFWLACKVNKKTNEGIKKIGTYLFWSVSHNLQNCVRKECILNWKKIVFSENNFRSFFFRMTNINSKNKLNLFLCYTMPCYKNNCEVIKPLFICPI